MSDRPNILFIISDQHNAKVLGHAGHPQVQTPHLDRLAAEGTRCTNAVTANPICTPSRTSFHSGQYCHNHGYYGLSGPNPGGLPSLYGHARDHGYRTAAIGKIHCPEGWLEADCDVFHETCHCSVGGRSAAYSAFLGEREPLEDHMALTEFGIASRSQGRQKMDSRPSPMTFDECQEGWIANQAIRTMDQSLAAGQPFLIQASLPRPHQCTTPCPEFWDLYEDVELAMPPNLDYDMAAARKAPHVIATAENWKKPDWAMYEPKTVEAARQRKLRGYLGAISQCDAAVGRMLAALEQRGILENTIVIYTSDHGDYACEHGIMEKAPGISHDAITRIPFIWRGPGIPAGAVREHLVQSVDLAPTLCARAGLPAMITADGVDASPLLEDDRPVREVAVTEFALSKAIRKGDWRLVYYPPEFFAEQYPDSFGELYHVGEDPWEMRNRWFDDDCAAIRRELEGDLLRWLVTTTRPKTSLGPSANPWGDRDQNTRRFGCWAGDDHKLHPQALLDCRGKNYL